MEYHKIMNLLDNTSKRLFKFRTKTWGETNMDAHETYNTNSELKFKTTMLKSSLCCYSNV